MALQVFIWVYSVMVSVFGFLPLIFCVIMALDKDPKLKEYSRVLLGVIFWPITITILASLTWR